MPVLPRALEIQGEIAAIRRDIHAHPELAFEETRTSDIVAAKLQEWGIEVTRGLGKTGVVGTLRKGNSVRSIGLRADMDCLPMDEANDFGHRSRSPGRMHACGHDGHTAMLLGAAKILSETRNFEGAVHFIFQPAEEGGGGARVMIEDGLFEKFPCDAVFAIHNKPGIPVGHIVTKGGPLLAAADRWDIHITGKGGHAAHPHLTLDPMVVGANVVLALQTIVSRNVDPIDSGVVTVGG
jgi:amidohydrolase